MFCPECGAEFQDGIATCADCDVPLTEEAPPEPEIANDVAILETSDLAAVPVIKSALRAAGIPFAVEGEDRILPIEGHASGSARDVVIKVPEERAEEARQLLEQAATFDDEAGETA